MTRWTGNRPAVHEDARAWQRLCRDRRTDQRSARHGRASRAPWPTGIAASGFDQLAADFRAAPDADIHLSFWNADGSRSAACGNATRCIARHVMRAAGPGRADHLDRPRPAAGRRCRRRADLGQHGASRSSTGTRSRWRARWTRSHCRSTAHRPRPAWAIRIAPSSSTMPRRSIWPASAPRSRLIRCFPQRTNVQFAQVDRAGPSPHAGLGARHRDHAGLRLVLLRDRRSRPPAAGLTGRDGDDRSRRRHPAGRLARRWRLDDRPHGACLRRQSGGG